MNPAGHSCGGISPKQLYCPPIGRLSLITYRPFQRRTLKSVINQQVSLKTSIHINHVLFAGSLPAILRKCMHEKFAEFDQYQLGKHGSKMKSTPLMDTEELTIKARRFSVKRLIRLLHIKDPVFHVLAILGKK